jgi:hypothetical protein
VAHAGGPQASTSATRTARGPLLKRPRSSGVTSPRARSFCAVWRTSLTRVKPTHAGFDTGGVCSHQVRVGGPSPAPGHELARPTRSASLLTRTVGGPGIMARSQRRTATRLCHHRVSDDGTSRSVWCSQACLAPGHGHHVRTPDRRLKTLALPRRKKRNKSALRSRLSLDKRRPHKGSASLVVTFRDVLCS